ncbi:MAG: MmgE/PrpD family protein [Proteobacteria bacterium]|nr:MmgE/PrpD family protein [Pseudomonadota bacterium]
MRALAAYVGGALKRRLPAEVAEKGKHHFLDTLAAMVSGSRLGPGLIAVEYMRGQGGRAEALVVGTPLVTSAVNAAFANGMSAHADETDDSHAPSFTHPGCGVVPAALAMAEREGSTGDALLKAVVLGYDVNCRATQALGVEALYGAHYSTHSIGPLFGAAAAAGALAGLGERQVRHLLSYAAQQASGLASWQRDEEHVEKAFAFGGMPARNGMAAATMVAHGFTGVDDVFAGDHNLFACLARGGGRPAEFARGLGRDYEIMRANIKKWSVGSPIQAALDSLQALMREHRFAARDVEAIEVRVGAKEALVVNDRTMPDICMQHLVALMLLDGAVTFASSHDYGRMRARSVLAERRKVRLIPDPALANARPRRQAIVTVRLKDGRSVRHRTRAVRGTADNPMTRAEVAEKCLDLMAPVLGRGRAKRLIEAVWAIERLASVRALRPLLRA